MKQLSLYAITLGDLLARLGASTWSDVGGKQICVFGALVNSTYPTGIDNPEIILANSPISSEI